MSEGTAIIVENISKLYQLGEVGTGTLTHDLNRWWHRIRGKEDPYSIIGEKNVRSEKGDSEFVWAIKDINFKVMEGEVLGIIGKNGAGKSTLLKILSQVTGPTSGRIVMKGRVGSLLEVGTGFHPDLTGRENIYLNGAILGMTKQEISRKMDEIVEFAGVARYLDTPTKRYSSGMKVRLGFAVAAHLEPEILIVDEVLAVGDLEFQKKAVGKMQEVSSGEGRTVLFVSHNMASVQSLCTRCLYLKDGMVYKEGDPESMIEEYTLSDLELDDSRGFRDLEQLETRKGNGLLRITRIECTSTDGRILNVVRCGQSIWIKLKFKTNRPRIDNVNVFLGLYDSTNNIISAFNNEMSGGELFQGVMDEGYFVCHIPKIHVMPGHYHLSIMVKCNDQLTDLIENALGLQVESGDYYGTGKIYPNSKVKTLVDHKWTLKRDET